MSGLNSARLGFSLVEVVVAVGIIAFALISMLGVLTISMTVHQDASNDSVFSIMTESALQEVRNFSAPGTTTYNFSNLYNTFPLTASHPGDPGYIFFDEDGQITLDGYRTGTTTVTQSTSGVTSTDLGILWSPPSTINSSNSGNVSVPLGSIPAALPATTYYTCRINILQQTLYNSTDPSSNFYFIKLTFTWPQNMASATPATTGYANHSRVILTSISNNTN